MELLIFWLVGAGIAAAIAGNKGRSALGFFLLALLISPLLGILIALVAKSDEKNVEKAKLQTGSSKKCPFCAEIIKAEATVCRFCGRDVLSQHGAKSVYPMDNRQKYAKKRFFYQDEGGATLGPVDQTQLQELVNQGRVTGDTYVRPESETEWSHLEELVS